MRSTHSALDNMWSISSAAILALSVGALWVWPKLVGVDLHPIFGWAEAQTGQSWLEPGARVAVGVLAAGLIALVLIPRTRLVGAWGMAALSTAFILAHLTPALGMNIPEYAALTEALRAGMTAEQIRAAGLPNDQGLHFCLALMNAGLAVITIVAEVRLRAPRENFRPHLTDYGAQSA